MTLKEWAERSWKAAFGDKTYEEVEREYEEKRLREAPIFLADLPYKKKED